MKIINAFDLMQVYIQILKDKFLFELFQMKFYIPMNPI
jgi:hypothetical protein